MTEQLDLIPDLPPRKLTRDEAAEGFAALFDAVRAMVFKTMEHQQTAMGNPIAERISS
jgi:hypothetical protein